jgi:hypothetical protein
MEVITLVRHEHMLGGDTRTTNHVVESQTAWDFLLENDVFGQDVRVFLNNEPVGPEKLKSRLLAAGDKVNVVNMQKTEAAVAWLVAEGFNVVVATILVNIAVSLAVNFLISTVFGPDDRGQGSRGTRKDPEGYGVVGGSNQARRFAPLPIVMGKHRIFPDYASPWSVDYVTDYAVYRNVCNNTPVYGDVVMPDFAFSPSPASKAWNLFTPAEQVPTGWTAAPSNPPWGTESPYLFTIDIDDVYYCATDANHSLVIKWAPPALGQPWTSGVIQWTTYQEYWVSVNQCQETQSGPSCPSANWRTYTSGQTVNIVKIYGYLLFETTQRLTNVFSYGFGDMTLSDHYIGTTAVSSFRDITITPTVFSSTATSLIGWRRGPDLSTGPFLEYPANCESVDGGELKQNSGSVNNGWVTRESSRKTTTFIEVDFAGRLFRNASGGAETLSRVFDCQYRLVGAGAWTQAPGFPVTFSNGDTTIFRQTERWSVPSGRYEVQVRKVSDDETDAANVCDVNFERAKFYVDDAITTYPAINRVGVQVLASGQLNGALDRWSSIAETKCWVYTASVYDGTEPGASANWSWVTTQNPAWWLLYFTMGGFLNTTDPKGWKLGVHSTNGERLFGAGLPNSAIDLATIHQFSKWCTSKNLKFNAVVDSQRPCADVMIDIAQAGRGSPNWSNDKFTVVWADTADIPVAQFGMGNIVAGSFEIGYNINRRTDELVASFNDENDFYISRQVRALVPGVTNPVNSSSLQFFGVTTEDQAQREINLRAADIKYHIRRIGFETSIEGMVPQRGDVVLLAHDLTAWAYSGRLQDISSDGLTLTLPRALHDPAAGPDYWIQIRLPDGTFMVEKIAPPLSPVTTVTLSTALPDFPDHFPEDFLFQAGPSATPGKRCRVLSLEPTQNETVKITCTDDYPEYYLQENSLTGEEPDNDERLIAKVYNPVVEVRDDGYWLCWEAENCRGAQVSASVSGGTGSIIGGNLTVPGLELKLPVYPSGTVISLTLVPDDVVNAVASVSASTTFTY